MSDSGKINNAYRSFQKLASDHPNPITNSYDIPAKGKPERTPIDIKVERDTELIYNSQIRVAKADDELERLKRETRQLEHEVTGTRLLKRQPVSTDYGSYFRKR